MFALSADVSARGDEVGGHEYELLYAGGWIGTTAVVIGIADDAIALFVHATRFIENFDLQLDTSGVVVDVPDVGADAVIV